MAASQHWLVICKSGEGSELKPNSYGEADFARIAWWESQRRDWLAVCVALCAPFCSFSLWQGCAPTEQSRETMGRPTLVPFWPPFCKHGSVEGQRRTVPTEKPTQFSRAPGGGTWPYFPGRQYKPPHPGARAGPGTTHWHPVTTQSPTPGCMHGLAYYCVPLACHFWLSSLLLLQSNHKTPTSPLDFTPRESSLVTEDHRSSSAILPNTAFARQALPSAKR